MFPSPYRLSPGHHRRMGALHERIDRLCEAEALDCSEVMKLCVEIKRLEGRVLFDPTVTSNWLIAVPSVLAFALILWT